jgi:hypothetical protein
MPPAVPLLGPPAIPRLPTCPPLGAPVELADGLPLDEGVPALVLVSCDSVVAQP